MQIEGRRFLVVGLGRSGLAAVRSLSARGAQVTAADRAGRDDLGERLRSIPPQTHLILGEHRQEDFLEADCIVLSPGVPASLPPIRAALDQGIPVWSEVELAFRLLKGTVVGVTGSNGKTTVTEMIGEICRRAGRAPQVAGNIGRPLLEAVEEASGAECLYVVELSSFQLEMIERFRCDTALMLNITPDHLDRYPSFEDYRRAKERIFLNQRPEDCAVLNADDPWAARTQDITPARLLRYSRRNPVDEGAFLRGGRMVLRWRGEETELMDADDLKVAGSHNLENALAAAAAALSLGVEASDIAAALTGFRSVEHRLEHFASLDRIDVYNDSKATNIDSTLKALQAFPGRRIVVILGGLDKGSDFSALRGAVEQSVRCMILIGAAANKIEDALAGAAPLLRARDIEQAAGLAMQKASDDNVVLLAPACASFDQFRNYEERGRRFKEAIRREIARKTEDKVQATSRASSGGRPTDS